MPEKLYILKSWFLGIFHFKKFSERRKHPRGVFYSIKSSKYIYTKLMLPFYINSLLSVSAEFFQAEVANFRRTQNLPFYVIFGNFYTFLVRLVHLNYFQTCKTCLELVNNIYDHEHQRKLEEMKRGTKNSNFGGDSFDFSVCFQKAMKKPP